MKILFLSDIHMPAPGHAYIKHIASILDGEGVADDQSKTPSYEEELQEKQSFADKAQPIYEILKQLPAEYQKSLQQWVAMVEENGIHADPDTGYDDLPDSQVKKSPDWILARVIDTLNEELPNES